MSNLACLVHFPTMVSVSGVMTKLRKGKSVKGAFINTFDKGHDYGVAVGKEHAMVASGATLPPLGNGSLYVRSLLMGTGPVLGVGPSFEYTCLIYISPVSSYHKGALNLVVEDKLYRAILGRTGGIKVVTKYSLATWKLLNQGTMRFQKREILLLHCYLTFLQIASMVCNQ